MQQRLKAQPDPGLVGPREDCRGCRGLVAFEEARTGLIAWNFVDFLWSITAPTVDFGEI